jgi:hypothetical protein
MNLYIIVEGRHTESILYKRWIPTLLPDFQNIERVDNALHEGCGNTFYILAGMGYPAYKKRIHDAVKDCASTDKPFHLIVCTDAEDVSLEERLRENQETVDQALSTENLVSLRHSIIVADCCIETWLLGNAKFIKRNPGNPALRNYLGHYNVIAQDPEKMPMKIGDRNRADTHLKYLKAVYRERGMSYSKSHPGNAAEPHYLNELVERARAVQPDGSRHLRSFFTLLSLCDELKNLR